MFAARAANRRGARQQYRTMARMQRRRSYLQNSMGMHQDFSQRDDGNGYEEAPQQQAPDVNQQIEQLADLKRQGLITEEEFSAKKKQLLGI